MLCALRAENVNVTGVNPFEACKMVRWQIRDWIIRDCALMFSTEITKFDLYSLHFEFLLRIKYCRYR